MRNTVHVRVSMCVEYMYSYIMSQSMEKYSHERVCMVQVHGQQFCSVL